MRDQQELHAWLLDNEKKFEPTSFDRGLHFFHKVFKPAMLHSADIDVIPVSHYPYGRDLNKDKPNLTFRLDMVQGGGEGAREPYETMIEFDGWNAFGRDQPAGTKITKMHEASGVIVEVRDDVG